MAEWYFVSKLATFTSLGRYSYVYLERPNDHCFDWDFGHVLEGDVIWALGINTCFFHIHTVVPHKAVAEVSRIGNYRRDWLL